MEVLSSGRRAEVLQGLLLPGERTHRYQSICAEDSGTQISAAKKRNLQQDIKLKTGFIVSLTHILDWCFTL